MTKFASLAAVTLAAAASMAAPTAAQAQTATGQGTPYNLFTGVTNGGTFGNNGSIGNATFSNVFTFVVTRAGTLATDFSNSASANNQNGDIDFTGATLTGPSGTFSYSKLLGETTMPSSLTEVWNIMPFAISAGTYTLTVTGRSFGAGSTYSGNFNVASVPEPTSWALLTLGVGLVGGALRRRQRVSVRYAAA